MAGHQQSLLCARNGFRASGEFAAHKWMRRIAPLRRSIRARELHLDTWRQRVGLEVITYSNNMMIPHFFRNILVNKYFTSVQSTIHYKTCD
ncbi:hypothetical protein KIN20_006714 [Parelaphostrongylus tenuis]|uniref:Uncharacterized protein n=1 Tax=Parelaphostrongylus tenuis TaxID=148309 RepID=A0AAD5M6H4_PARTN|nr:hypothetical protein KIN20_006714 [Parelaphostrongylus tenuis]